MRISKKRLEALLAVAGRGIDELESDLDDMALEDVKKTHETLRHAYEAYRYLLEWQEELANPKPKKAQPSKEEMLRDAMKRIGVALSSPKIHEIVNS